MRGKILSRVKIGTYVPIFPVNAVIIGSYPYQHQIMLERPFGYQLSTKDYRLLTITGNQANHANNAKLPQILVSVVSLDAKLTKLAPFPNAPAQNPLWKQPRTCPYNAEGGGVKAYPAPPYDYTVRSKA
jgi:hypothetical protein